jgi:hypothetical protein
MTRETRWFIGIAALTGAMLFLNIVSGPSSLRSLVNLLFLLLCPGMAWVWLLGIREAWVGLVLGIMLSVGLDGLVAGVMTYTKIWAPSAGVGILAGISLAGIVYYRLQ